LKVWLSEGVQTTLNFKGLAQGATELLPCAPRVVQPPPDGWPNGVAEPNPSQTGWLSIFLLLSFFFFNFFLIFGFGFLFFRFLFLKNKICYGSILKKKS
jgi:hypothetical protein